MVAKFQCTEYQQKPRTAQKSADANGFYIYL